MTYERRERSSLEVLLTFLKLGVTSFGGPMAHIGYFREEIVVRRRWLEDAAYTELVALCQFLPGPASSQVGFTLGMMRAGWRGGIAAWTGFTLPSAILLTLFAYGAGTLNSVLGHGLLHGLRLVAIAIVAQAVWGMARTQCPDRRAAIAGVVATLLIFFGSSSVAQIAAIILGGATGLWLCRSPASSTPVTMSVPVSRRVGVIALALFFILLVGLPAARGLAPELALFDAFYRCGALVFGGGHVVLPLLNDAFVAPGWITEDRFLAGYGAAQAVPGPLFTFAAYLGATVRVPPHGLAGSALGLIALFLPGMLILIAALPFWDQFRRRAAAQAITRGINAAVVGLLGAALYNPLWINSVKSAGDLAVALLAFVLLVAWRAPPLLAVAVGAIGGIALAMAA